MYRSLVLAALVVPLALGDDSTPPGTPQTEYSYDYTDVPTTAPTTQTTTISTLFVKPASTATNACPKDKSCYPPEKFLAERVASQGLDNTADWNNIDQQVGTLADQIVAKIC